MRNRDDIRDLERERIQLDVTAVYDMAVRTDHHFENGSKTVPFAVSLSMKVIAEYLSPQSGMAIPPS